MPIPSGPSAVELPDWAADRSHVADYIPHRTVQRDTDSVVESEDTYRFDWDDTTTPTAETVNRLIADGVAYVSARVTPMAVVSESAAGVLVSLYAAASVERGWPDDDQSLQRANDLEKRFDLLLADLIVSNRDANSSAGLPLPGAPAVLPVWSFPPPDPRFDSAAYF